MITFHIISFSSQDRHRPELNHGFNNLAHILLVILNLIIPAPGFFHADDGDTGRVHNTSKQTNNFLAIDFIDINFYK